MMRYLTGLVAGCMLASCAQAPKPAGGEPTVTIADLAVLEGSWTGTLTYRDYSPPFEDVSIPATLEVARQDEGIRLQLDFPDEPSAYDTSMLTPSDDGRMLNSETVVGRTEDGGAVTLLTQSSCEDDGRMATCDMEYTLSPQVFAMTKIVRLESGEAAFRRNAYAFERAGERD